MLNMTHSNVLHHVKTFDDRMKYEIAEELGLLEKVREEGWKALSAKDTGRIGGLMTKRKRELKAGQTSELE